MVDTPERIWMSAPDIDNEHDVWFDPSEGGTEYLRADLAALRAAVPDESVLRQALQLCVDMIVANGLETALSNTLETAREALAASPAVPEGEPVAVKPLPMDCAPKDSTMCRLLVDYGEDDFGALEDSAEPTWTIGFNQFDHTGDDEWLMAGWDWSHDVFTQGQGKVIGWLPFHSAPRPDMERELAEARSHVAELELERERFATENLALAADKARLEVVLRPFADAADRLHENTTDDRFADTALATIRVGQLRATRAALSGASIPASQQEAFPQPERNRAGKEPCGECRIQPGETCDICGASIPAPDKAEARREALEEAAVADQIIGQIEERFPSWRSYRDLIDCIDCTLNELRSA